VTSGSYVTLGIGGAQRPVTVQSVSLAPGVAGQERRTTTTATLPRINLAFGEWVDLFQNQELTLDLNPLTGSATAQTAVWVFDSDGNRIDLPLALTTGVPTATDCSGFRYCLGIPGEPAHCAGTPWSPGTGELGLVGVIRVPFGTGTTIDCSGIFFRIKATLAGGDTDGDGKYDAVDNCFDVSNASQTDVDGDGWGNACDNCPTEANMGQRDGDLDGLGNACEPLAVNFQPLAAPSVPGYAVDAGAPFSAATGRGWSGSGTVATVDRNVTADQLLDTLAHTTIERRWQGVLPPGAWDVSATIGDPAYPQGPQRASLEGEVVFDGVQTAAGQHLTASIDRLFVTDGRFTVEIGGGGGVTALDYLTAAESPTQPFRGRYVNFQPSASPVPPGFTADTGAPWSAATGMGWDANLSASTRDRHVLHDPVLDTLIFTATLCRWELALEADYYDVHITVGDTLWAQGPQRVLVEGAPWLEGVTTAAGELLTLSGTVLVTDGELTLDVGGGGGNTTLTHVAVASLPRDADGDGVTNLDDNCPFDANSDQADADGDGVGNACSADGDGDGFADRIDNCPDVINPSQADQDGDLRGDACDCGPQDASAWAVPAQVGPLYLDKSSPTGATLVWASLSGQAGPGTVYDVVTGSLATLQADGSFAAATCLADDVSTNGLDDARVPAAGSGLYHLVRGDNACGPGSYGEGDSPALAALDAAGPCP
jgi:hypothetical protein